MIYEEVVVLQQPFDDALAAVKAAFADVGFGTLTEIDMQATMKAKVDKDMDSYVIVGACNPHLASRALDIVPQIGVLLPCNVAVRQVDDDVVVEVMDPGLMGTISGHPDMAPLAEEARDLVNDALQRLGTSSEAVAT